MPVSLLLLLLAADPQTATDAVIETAAAAERMKVPAMTPVYVKIDEEVSSKRNKIGERFRISVAEDVALEGRVVIPAGAAGEGEVIHAARSSVGGKPGELLLAARFVKVGDVDVPLRSMVLGRAGQDRLGGAIVAMVVYAPLAFVVVGGAVVVPEGTLASAKTSVEIELPVHSVAVMPSPVAPAEATPAVPVDQSKGGESDEKKAN